MRKVNWSRDLLEQAAGLYLDGYSIDRVSEQIGIPYTTLGRHFKNIGITREYTKRMKLVHEDLAGKKFGKLLVLRHVFEEEGRILWICECECGVQQKIRMSHLLKGKRMCGSCAMTGERSFAWKGCGKLSGTCWKHIKNSAKRKSRLLPFSISQEYAWSLYEKQEGKCALTGQLIDFPEKVEDGAFPSLDRIDSSQGYIEGNVQWVHKDINTMKWSLDQDRFIHFCHLVAQYKEDKCCL